MRTRRHEEIAHTHDDRPSEGDCGDRSGNRRRSELLSLIFTACPRCPRGATLRVVDGLTTDEMVRAFLANEAAIAQGIVRAKKAIANAGLSFDVPCGAQRTRG